jgi:hypothetical protein
MIKEQYLRISIKLLGYQNYVLTFVASAED